jgi:hypothetical protein
MTRETAEKILALIGAAHGIDTTDATVDAWQLILNDMDDAAAIEATILALRSSHYPPKPADILAASRPAMLDAHAAYLEWQRELRDDPPIDVDGVRRYRLSVWSNPLVPVAGYGLSVDGDEFPTRNAYTSAYNRLTAEYQATGRLPAGVPELPEYQPRYTDEASLGPVLEPGRAPQVGQRTREESDLEKVVVRRELLAPESGA